MAKSPQTHSSAAPRTSAGQPTAPLVTQDMGFPASPSTERPPDVIVLAGQAFLHLFFVLLLPFILAARAGWGWSFIIGSIGLCFLIAYCQVQEPRKGMAYALIAAGLALLVFF